MRGHIEPLLFLRCVRILLVRKIVCCREEKRMKTQPFDRQKHIYRNDAFVELVKDAVRFFNGTPVVSLPPPETFLGTGVYALYYIGKHPLYAKYGEMKLHSPLWNTTVDGFGNHDPGKGRYEQAISDWDVPDPREAHGIPDHIFRGGARTYVGDTGSDLDVPAKTVKAGGHSIPGGENMIRFRDGSVRYFTVYEAKLI